MSIWLAMLLIASPSVEPSDRRCNDATHLFFTEGSAEIDSDGAEALSAFLDRARADGIPGYVRIESGGDGAGKTFDRELSLRRSEAIRNFLSAHGQHARETVIAIDEVLGQAAKTGRSYIHKLGWVFQSISTEDYARLHPSDLIIECF